MSRGSRRTRGGFTLLEVLAAVAILGISYSVLATVGMQGLRAEGESGRRLEASLLADQYLADVEAQMASNLMPEISDPEEYEEDPFLVRVEVAAFELPLFAGLAEDAESLIEDADSPDAAALAAAQELLMQSLRTIRVEVVWTEGESELLVRRTTFGFEAALPGDSLGLEDILADDNSQ